MKKKYNGENCRYVVLYLLEIDEWNAHGDRNDEVIGSDNRVDFSKHFGH